MGLMAAWTVLCRAIVVKNGAVHVADRDYGNFMEEFTQHAGAGDLDMCSQDIDDNGAAQIASLLTENGDAHTDLKYNAIENSGIAALCNALCVNATLLVLDETGNTVRAAELVSTATVLTSFNKTLQFINLSENPVFTATSGVAWEGQREALPHLVAMSSLDCLGLTDTAGLGDGKCEVIGDALILKNAACLFCSWGETK